MLPLLALHALVNLRGDGLRPELLALIKHSTGGSLSAPIEPETSPFLYPMMGVADELTQGGSESSEDSATR